MSERRTDTGITKIGNRGDRQRVDSNWSAAARVLHAGSAANIVTCNSAVPTIPHRLPGIFCERVNAQRPELADKLDNRTRR
jgi:hypothetical protein